MPPRIVFSVHCVHTLRTMPRIVFLSVHCVHTLRTMPRIVFLCAGFGQRPRLRGVQPPQLWQGGQESTSHLTTRVCRHVETGSLPFLWMGRKIPADQT